MKLKARRVLLTMHGRRNAGNHPIMLFRNWRMRRFEVFEYVMLAHRALGKHRIILRKVIEIVSSYYIHSFYMNCVCFMLIYLHSLVLDSMPVF